MAHFIKAIGVGLLLLAGSVFALPGTVNVNTASAEELAEMLDGVGLARAEAIIEYREQHGSFDSLADLQEVRGIGPHTIEVNEDVIAFSD